MIKEIILQNLEFRTKMSEFIFITFDAILDSSMKSKINLKKLIKCNLDVFLSSRLRNISWFRKAIYNAV